MKTQEFNNCFLEQKAALFAYILGFVKIREDAEDVLQELYLKLWKRRKTIKQDTSRSYFYRSAKSLCIDVKRKAKRMNDYQFNLVYEPVSENSLEKQELTMHFRRLVSKLPENYREVVYLKDICLLDTREVIEVSGLSESNVRVLLSRARKMIKEELGKIYSYEHTEKQR